nr:ATP-binding protein [Paenactinomyces guangxiensis]
MVPSAEEEKENPDDDEIGRLARLISRLESRLTREEQFRNQLIADAAHELRTPITILRGQLESFSAKEQVHPAQLLPLVDETMRMSRLIQDLQQLSLAEARKLSLHKSWLQLPLWLNEIFEVLKTEAEEKQIALEITQTANGEVYWDSSRMKQVLLNLIGNALQYTPRNGKVLISAQEYAGKIEIKIRDNGPGIPPEKLPYIFQRFYRVEGSRNRLSGGSGLGLAIAKEFVEIHEGKIRVESELGEGTTFTLEVPVFPETDSLR